MIAYELLVQTIADWKAGVRPTAPVPPQAAAPEVVEEYDSGIVDIDDQQYGEPQQYEEPQYGSEEYATETYADDDEQE